jgi:predicted branched-subunit amino acid permease
MSHQPSQPEISPLVADRPKPDVDVKGASSPMEPTFSASGLLIGLRMMMPLVPGIIFFAAAFGAAAAAKGLTLGEAVLMSAVVFAGVSQLVGLEIWQPAWTWSALIGLMVVTATINGRMILQGASLYPWLKQHPAWFNALHLTVLTDANWILGERYRAAGGRDIGMLVGAGVTSWIVWVVMTIPGFLVGSLIPDPKAFGLDMVMPIVFVAMAVPLWRGKTTAIPWLVAGIVSYATSKFVPGYAYIVTGALAGVVTGALRREP